MAPGLVQEQDLQGYWGKPTATINWCEANYEVSYYVAEFWNTVSNVVMILPPLIGALMAYHHGLETRFICCHISLMMVGLGSWCFHGTLLYEMQLLDELPMIWGSAFLLYTLIEVDGQPKSHNRRLQIYLFLYCLVVSTVYITIKQPVFHEAAYGLMVVSMIGYSVRISRHFEHSYMLFISSIGTYALGFLLWNLDNMMCKDFRELRQNVGYPLKPLFQGHAWWHILAGIGTYLGLMFNTHARLKYLKRPHELKMKMGCIPYIVSPVPHQKLSHSNGNTAH